MPEHRAVLDRGDGRPPSHPPSTDLTLPSHTRRLSPRTLLTLLAAACTGACAPIVTHGPRVQGGTHVVVTAGAGFSPCDTVTCDLELLPQAALGIRTGRAATATRPGFALGVNASINLVSSELDLYAQAPAGFAPFDAGAGVLLSPAHTMPYVQAGHTREDGSGFYTTQGFVWMSQRQTDYSFFDPGPAGAPDELVPRYWAPSVAYRTRGRHGVHLYVSGALGTAAAYAYPMYGGPELQRVGSQPVRWLMAGAVFEGEPRDLLVGLIPLLIP